jgi:hypothetical protein
MPKKIRRGDNRHTSVELYWRFLKEVWEGVAPLLKAKAHIVLRIGGNIGYAEAREGLIRSLREGISGEIHLLEDRRTSVEGSRTATFQPNARGSLFEYDFHFQVVK